MRVTLPILLSFIFELLKPIVIVDVTGISLIIGIFIWEYNPTLVKKVKE